VSRTRPVPVMVGYGPPGMGEGMAPIPEKAARGLTLTNETTMPVVIGAQAGACAIVTRGPVQGDKGKDIGIKCLPENARTGPLR
jgi:hypothetical protein